MFSRMAPKRNFSDSFERQVEKLSSLLPGGNIGLAVVALNTFFYTTFLMWPAYTKYQYMNNFTFSTAGLQ